MFTYSKHARRFCRRSRHFRCRRCGRRCSCHYHTRTHQWGTSAQEYLHKNQSNNNASWSKASSSMLIYCKFLLFHHFRLYSCAGRCILTSTLCTDHCHIQTDQTNIEDSLPRNARIWSSEGKTQIYSSTYHSWTRPNHPHNPGKSRTCPTDARTADQKHTGTERWSTREVHTRLPSTRLRRPHNRSVHHTRTHD